MMDISLQQRFKISIATFFYKSQGDQQYRKQMYYEIGVNTSNYHGAGHLIQHDWLVVRLTLSALKYQSEPWLI
ncbi:TPA: hypothetical protein M2P61_003715 [Klebsiella quasipneumoniae]|nr:hypothetical protein [Klebsiella quasipneumoniae]